MNENQSQELEKSLQKLATSLETPVVPGELENWVATVRQAAEKVAGLLRRDIDTVHSTEYAQIVKEDAELFRRVEQLRAGDDESLSLLGALLDRIEELAKKAQRKEPDEASLDDEVKRFTDQGLAFVIHAQKQEVARRTWLQEAFYRDRGVVD